MDERVQRGLERHFLEQQRRADTGAKRLGYKVAFNVPAAQAKLGIAASLVAGIDRSTLVDSGSVVAVGDMTAPLLEAEIAVRLGKDVDPGCDSVTVAGAVDGIAASIELVDLNRSLDQLEDILAEGVFHRAVAFGPFRPAPGGASLAGLRVDVAADDKTVFTGDAQDATGTLTGVLQHIAAILDSQGQRLVAGDHVILGSMAPPVQAKPGGRFRVCVDGYGEVDLAFK